MYRQLLQYVFVDEGVICLMHVLSVAAEIIEEPCDGAPVEINPLTGEEFVCSKNGDQSCPANSYCHIIEGEQHGRCCKQGLFIFPHKIKKTIRMY